MLGAYVPSCNGPRTAVIHIESCSMCSPVRGTAPKPLHTAPSCSLLLKKCKMTWTWLHAGIEGSHPSIGKSGKIH